MISVLKIHTKEDLQKAFTIREKVFVIEQNVAKSEEFDKFEDTSIHFLAIENNIPLGTARWRVIGDKIKLERFAVLKETRKKGVGAALVKAVLEDIESSGEQKKIYMHAQVHAVGFYEKLGFKKEGELFLECDIEHFTMVK